MDGQQGGEGSPSLPAGPHAQDPSHRGRGRAGESTGQGVLAQTPHLTHSVTQGRCVPAQDPILTYTERAGANGSVNSPLPTPEGLKKRRLCPQRNTWLCLETFLAVMAWQAASSR